LKKPEPTLGEGEVLIRVKAWWVEYFTNWYFTFSFILNVQLDTACYSWSSMTVELL
jgi:NADPH:quinone reductase-like Zn-dependent oxidoreductase